MGKVIKKKLKSSELAEVKKRTSGKSEKDKTMLAIGKGKKDKSKKDLDKNVNEIMKVVDKSKKKDKSKKEVKKDKSKKTIPTKEVKQAIKDLDLPKVLNTRHVTQLVEEVTDYSLGIDLTAGAKNLRRYLRSLPQYNDDAVTSYSWSVKDDEDLQELAEILGHYQIKARQA